jgi:hypothetical protein
MEKLIELEKSEMIEISGGVNPAYELGYAIGSTLRELLIINGLRSLFLL